jgi:DNA-binding NtrC family response regulator
MFVNSQNGGKRILLVDPDEAFGPILKDVLGSDFKLRQVSSAETGIALLEDDSEDVDVVLLNLDHPSPRPLASPDPRTLLQISAERGFAPPVIAYSSDVRREMAADAIRHGAFDFFVQPLDVLELKVAMDQACRRITLMRELAAVRGLVPFTHVEGLLGNSKPMERVNEMIRKVAGVSTTVLVTGESGTGKEVAARAIHHLSPRAAKPFVAFSPSALAESLIEDELFGHEKGAFTGAAQSRRGRFEEARGGTIFLDEIGDLVLPLQAKLLRVLQERKLERLGSNVAVPVDVRVICATNRDLEKMVQEGSFRQDLYFRISVVRIHMPPLRERADDIPVLAEYFLQTFVKAHGKHGRSLTLGFLSALAGHNWPGNVRELQNVIERSLVLSNGSRPLGIEDLPQELRGLTTWDEVTEGSFHRAVQNFKRELVRATLRRHSGNKVRAAQELHISRCYLHRLLNQLNITEGIRAREEGETLPQGANASAIA